MSITRNVLNDTSITRDFHERIVTIDNTSDNAAVNKLPVANQYGYLDRSWLQDYSSFKIKERENHTVTSSFSTSTDESEFIDVITLGSRITITLSGDYIIENVPYTRALVYRFFIYNPDNYELEWATDYPEGKFVWNTYSETPPTLDENGTYIEFISTDRGATWYGIATDMDVHYDIVHDYYKKVESDDRFVNVTGDDMHGTLTFDYGNTGPYAQNISEENPTGDEIIYPHLVGKMAYNDQWRIGGGATASDSGFLEIATGDNAGINGTQVEPIYISQYQSDGFKKLIRRISLFDNEGNTLFPGNLTVGGADVVGGANNRVLTVNGSSNITGNASIAGAVNITNTTDAQYDTNTNPALTIGDASGYHIQIDGDEILAKKNSSTPSILYLNRDSGGNVVIGSGGLTTTGPINTTALSTSATPGTSDDSTYIATTEFVNNYKETYIDHWLVPDMGNSTKAMCLTNDGTNSFWVRYSNAPYVYCPNSDITSLTVPSSYLTTAIITEVYRNGVLLVNPDDYTINTDTGVINFKDTIGNGEKIIVTLENAIKVHSNEVLTGVTLNNSMASTPDSTDSSNRIATTEYVNRVLDLAGSGSQSSIPTHSTAFTGTPTAPTAAEGTNTTQIATTEFVNTAISNSNHAPIASPAFTGTPTAPTPGVNTNSTQIATTAFVKTNINNLIDGAQLRTLRMLSTAVNNDPTYYITVNDALATKIQRGITQSGEGNAVTSVTESNGVITVTKDSTFSLSNHNHDNDYMPFTPNVGSGINPIYTDNTGALLASTATVGSSTIPIYINNGVLTASDASLGSSDKPIYIENGELLESNSNIGSSDTPVYINNGTITSTNKNFSNYLLLTGGTVTGTLNLTDTELPLVVGNPEGQHLEIGEDFIQSSDDDTVSDLFINEDGGEVHFGNVDDGEVTIKNGVVTANTFVGNIGGTSEKASMDAEGNVIHTTYAPIDSPNFIGVATAPTPSAGETSTQIATTAFVGNAISTAIDNLIGSSSGALDTLNELAEALGNDPNFATTITSAINTKLDAGSVDYIKSLSINGTTLTVTAGDDSTSTLTTQDTTYTAGAGITIGINNEISANDQLPDQTNNAGKFLTTDGTDASWSDAFALPNQSGQSGKFLTTNGTTESWGEVSGFLPLSGGTLTGDIILDPAGATIENEGTTYAVKIMQPNSGEIAFSYDDYGPEVGNTKTIGFSLGGMSIGLGRHYDAATDRSNFYTFAPTPGVGDNSSRIATTAFVTTAINNIDALPDQTDNTGKFLTTDGTTARWEDISELEVKISSVHYPSVGDTTIVLTNAQTIPSDVNKYALAIYRDGIYLNAGIDYNFNPNNNTLTFIKAFDEDEIVTVLFTYISGDTQPALNLDIDEYEAGSNITFTENPVTNKITISATQPDTSSFLTSNDLSDYVTNTVLNTTLANYVETTDIPSSSDIVTTNSLASTLSNYATNSDISNFITASDVTEYEAGTNITFTNNSNTGKVTISADDPLPDQTNNTNKVLVTNGTTASWQHLTNIDIVVTPTANTATIDLSEYSNNIDSNGSNLLVFRDGFRQLINRDFTLNDNSLIFDLAFVADETVSVLIMNTVVTITDGEQVGY